MSTTKETTYFVVVAPGHYGDSTLVYSSHRTLAAARRACGDTCVVREGAKRKGERFLRSSEEIYPVAREK